MTARSRKPFRFVTDEMLSILQRHVGLQIDLEWLNIFVEAASSCAVCLEVPPAPGCVTVRWGPEATSLKRSQSLQSVLSLV